MTKSEIINELTAVGSANFFACSLVGSIQSATVDKVAEQAFIAGVDTTDVASSSVGEDDYPAAVLENAKAYLKNRINETYA
jgi:hypothetical protein